MNDAEFDYLGPYRVERTLGRGGMGTVYKGVHARSGEVIAIKVIASSVANSPRFRRRFAGEVETLQRLKHPNITSLVGFGEEQGLLFYTMEYVEGHSLHDHLRQHTKMPWSEVVQVGIETASALKHAHDLGIIHRDLKPANLMLNPQGQIKLTDFGIAKLFGSEDMTAAGSVIGTADYMPPEQAEGKPVTVRSDLYSLGGVLYALLCGKAPFGGKSVPEVLYSVRYNTVPSLLDRQPDVPPELAELIHELLQKDLGKRPPTALVVGNRLKSIQQGYRGKSVGNNSEGVKGDPDKAAGDAGRPSVGTQLTSLDLSDVDDEEFRLTGAEMNALGLPEKSEDESTPDSDGPGTHEQRTMIAPEDMELPEVDGTKLSSPPSRRESEFSGEFPVSPSAEEPITSGGPSHYTPVDEAPEQTFTLDTTLAPEAPGVDWLQFASAIGIVVLLIGALVWGWWMLRPGSADELYEEIQVAVESGEDSQAQVNEFLKRFPEDERTEELQELSDEAELTRRTRALRRAARGGKAENLSAIEQSFLDCMDARDADSDQADAKMQAFLQVYGRIKNLPRSQRRYVDLIDYASRRRESRLDTGSTDAAHELEKLVQSAEKSLTGEELHSYYKQLILLYRDKPWASEQVNRMQRILDADAES